MTELTSITQQPEVEFVNRELAEAEAKRAIELLTLSDESKVEAWFALQAVADQVGPRSNVGVLGISWNQPPRAGRERGWRGTYKLNLKCRDGWVNDQLSAPRTLEEAREPAALAKAKEALDRLVAEKGGRPELPQRPRYTSAALISAVSASPEGRAWLKTQSDGGRQALLAMVKVADAYGREGVYPLATRTAHHAFILFDDRRDLIRQYPEGDQARAKAMALNRGSDIPSNPNITVSPARVKKLAIRSGVTTGEARIILRAVMVGRSKRQLMRAVNEAIKMVGEDDSCGLRAA